MKTSLYFPDYVWRGLQRWREEDPKRFRTPEQVISHIVGKAIAEKYP